LRPKENRLVVTFRTTTDAFAFEAAGQKSGLAGRLIPVPRAITAGCGLAWSESPINRMVLEKLIADQRLGFEQLVELVI
jgi:hypothetical protein